jgi:hypothetical protein
MREATLSRSADVDAGQLVVPRRAVPAVARILPTAEALLGAGLIAGWDWRPLAWTSAALLTLMTASLLTVLMRPVPSAETAGQAGCGCFGSRKAQDSPPYPGTTWAGSAIARNLLLASAAVILATAS